MAGSGVDRSWASSTSTSRQPETAGQAPRPRSGTQSVVGDQLYDPHPGRRECDTLYRHPARPNRHDPSSLRSTTVRGSPLAAPEPLLNTRGSRSHGPPAFRRAARVQTSGCPVKIEEPSNASKRGGNGSRPERSRRGTRTPSAPARTNPGYRARGNGRRRGEPGRRPTDSRSADADQALPQMGPSAPRLGNDRSTTACLVETPSDGH